MVFAVMFERPWLLASEEPGEEASVGDASPVAQPCVEGGTDVSHHHQLLPHPALFHTLLIVLQVDACMHKCTTEDGNNDYNFA